jgi:DegV family protein with EDD domain
MIFLKKEFFMKIISDTTCQLSVPQAKELDILLVANQICLQEKSYKDYFDIDSLTLIKQLEDNFASTSQPAVGDIMELYEQTKNEDTIHITTGKGLSSEYDTACGIKASMDADHVSVFDSHSVAGVNHYITLLAYTLNQANLSKTEIIERLEACCSDSQSYVIPVNFKFLQKSGRLTAAGALIGGLFKLKPILAQSSNKLKIDKFALSRTWHGAIHTIVNDLIKKKIDSSYKIYVLHADNTTATNLAIDIINQAIPNADIVSFMLSPAMITHGGPQCLVIQYVRKDVLDLKAG